MCNIDQYVITIEHIDTDGEKKLKAAALDNDGPMASGYPCWTTFHPKYFSSIEAAENFFYQHKKYLLNDLRDNRCSLDSIKIQKCTLEFVKNVDLSESLDSIEEKRKNDADYAEYLRLKSKFEKD